MRKFKHIKSFPAPFLEDLVNSRCLPFIGAGFSKNGEVPAGKKMLDWDELGKAMAASIQDYKYTNAIDAISAYSHEYSRTNLVEKITELLLINSIKAGKAHMAFCDLQFDIVCTTNFEFLLEQGYASLSKYCRPILDEDQLSISNSSDAVTLLKLHGDLHHPKRLVVTEEDYDRFITGNPMLATYLGNLLITRTPLFIGYSLDDTDFRQIWQVIKERLGSLRRQAYTLKVDCSPHEKARYERRGVKVISLKGDPKDYPQILSEVFVELKEYWNQELLKQPTFSEEATLSELALPDDTYNRLCFFSIPVKLIPFYKKYIFPVVKKQGLVPISADDVIAPGDNWMAKISALVSKSEFIVVDIETKNTILELSLVLNEKKSPNRILIIKPDSSPLPTDANNLQYLVRNDDPFADMDIIINQINDWFERVLQPLREQYDHEPRRLLNKREYKAAVISAMTLFEIHLRQRLGQEKGAAFTTKPLRNLYSLALEYQILTEIQYVQARKWLDTRNKLVHTKSTVTSQEARSIVNGVYNVLERIEEV